MSSVSVSSVTTAATTTCPATSDGTGVNCGVGGGEMCLGGLWTGVVWGVGSGVGTGLEGICESKEKVDTVADRFWA